MLCIDFKKLKTFHISTLVTSDSLCVFRNFRVMKFYCEHFINGFLLVHKQERTRFLSSFACILPKVVREEEETKGLHMGYYYYYYLAVHIGT